MCCFCNVNNIRTIFNSIQIQINRRFRRKTYVINEFFYRIICKLFIINYLNYKSLIELENVQKKRMNNNKKLEKRYNFYHLTVFNSF